MSSRTGWPLDGARRDAELGGDFLVAQPIDEQGEDLELTTSQGLAQGRGRIDLGSPGGGRMNAVPGGGRMNAVPGGGQMNAVPGEGGTAGLPSEKVLSSRA